MMCVCVCVGLLHTGDRVLEVNGFPVDGMEPEQVIQVVVSWMSPEQLTCSSVLKWNLYLSLAGQVTGHHHLQGHPNDRETSP